ncbi:dTDP-4-dehydrorhamnose reductase [Geofilum rubicundum]|uniref:dTDP-4-dehydrorhamnose reductase n=1 Tax=Geofilum rubicundum JCM 15548 TaxID=1236989 RepID=A0A0E9LQM3_9BACT|nr:dTDP-4-dehydrorhamnose reductase [Geofilum rubicundum]GAO27598.1 dTDP-4-dehydrorhamnose reductase [Geofilum rubicundum JCM 15548]
MKILIVGGEGQLGSSLSALSETTEFAEFEITTINQLDLSKEENIKNYLTATHFDYIINCSAYTAVDKAETDKQTARLINALAPQWLARYAFEKGAGIIHISTDYVFDGTGNLPLTPEMPAHPDTVYGETKLEGELLVAQENSKHIIIRTSWLYSPYGNNFVKTMLAQASKKTEVKVVYDQVGTPTLAADLAAAILQILEQVKQKPSLFVPGIYHYSNLGVCSWFDFAQMIFRFSSLPVEVHPVRSSAYITAAHRPPYSVMDTYKIRHQFNLEIPYWTDSLKKCLKELS